MRGFGTESEPIFFGIPNPIRLRAESAGDYESGGLFFGAEPIKK
jgi:hypothetical protein